MRHLDFIGRMFMYGFYIKFMRHIDRSIPLHNATVKLFQTFKIEKTGFADDTRRLVIGHNDYLSADIQLVTFILFI